MWHSKKPCLKYLRVFGSTVYVLNKTRKRKFDDKSWKGILVGYKPNGYKVWDVENNKFVIARDVVFDESSRIMSRAVDVDNNMDFPILEKNIEPAFQDSGLIESETVQKNTDMVVSDVQPSEKCRSRDIRCFILR